MKNKLRFLKNKHNFIVLLILLAMVFNACVIEAERSTSGGGSGWGNNGNFTPIGFYVGPDGHFTEKDSGRTVVVADDKAKVVFYSDNIASSDDDRVGLTFEDKTIIFIFEKDRNFPYSILLSSPGESYKGTFTPYDPDDQTYDLTLEQGDEKETLSDVYLSKDIFTQYKYDPDLSQSQNLRMRNLYIAMRIYASMDDYFDSNDILQSNRSILSWFVKKVAQTFFPPPVANIVVGAIKIYDTMDSLYNPDAITIVKGIFDPNGLANSMAKDINDGINLITGGINELVSVAVTGVSLKSPVSLAVGATETLSPVITPSYATNKSVSWKSSNTSVATVSSNGTVTGVRVGTATITVTTANGNKTATCAITVNPVSVTGVSLDKNYVDLLIGDTETLTPTITPANAANKTVSWKSSNTAVATVSTSGTVTGVKAGTVRITVTTADGGKTAFCDVTVSPISVTGISLKESTGLLVGATETLFSVIEPDNATNKNVTWRSSNTAVATVSASGVVTGIKDGTAIITVTTEDGGNTAYCTVTVSSLSVSVTGVSLNKTSTSIIVGATDDLDVTITPSNATNQNVTWSSSNTAVATVSAGGTVTGIKAGTATITVTSVDGGKTASCTVTVSLPVYTVTFDSNGGNNVTSQTITLGDTVNRPTNPIRSGYTFDNWYSDSGLTTVYNFSTTVTGNITLYAKWNTVTYTVTFDSNGGSSVTSQTVNSGSTATRPTDPTKTGYTFDNWYSNSGLTTVYNFSTAVTGNITLYAKWNTVTYTVSFESNGGSSVSSQTVNSGSTATRPTNPTRSGYTFDNWYSNSTLTTVYNFSSTVTSNITLYAKWNTVSPTTYTVTFNSNGGSSVSSQTVNSGSTATRPTNPTKSGYTFDNWYSNSTLTTVYNFSTAVTGNITLYAKWNNVTYTVTFDSNGGSSVSSQSVNSGSTATRPTNPTRSGYTFDNWYSNSGLITVYNFSTAVTGNITLYAKWNPVTVNPSIIEMVYVLGGSFQMGDVKNEGYSNERPVHTVTLTGFYMGKYEVTQAQYQAVMGSNPSWFNSDPASGEVQGNRPVECVTWYDAVEFCNKLSIQEGLQTVYTISERSPSTGYPITSATITADWGKNGYRLPTEAEWEYAAKGGNGSPGNYTYSGSNTVGDVAWYWENSSDDVHHEVGKKAPNGLGLYDMSGNVWEWCWDWYGDYSSEAQTNPRGAAAGAKRVRRGGCWFSDASSMRSAYRANLSPVTNADSIGFRLVRP
jgi:uncharacterized repeat protein (TIGR02543 family)